MKNELVSFETAKLAKEKGFDEPSLYFYNKEGEIENLENVFNYGCEGGMYIDEWYKQYNSDRGYVKNVYSAPTQSLLQRWLREEYDIDVTADSGHAPSGKKYYFNCVSKGEDYDVCNWQNLHNDILDKAYQDVDGNYVNDVLYEKYLFKDGFAHETYEEALEQGLQEALKLIK